MKGNYLHGTFEYFVQVPLNTLMKEFQIFLSTVRKVPRRAPLNENILINNWKLHDGRTSPILFGLWYHLFQSLATVKSYHVDLSMRFVLFTWQFFFVFTLEIYLHFQPHHVWLKNSNGARVVSKANFKLNLISAYHIRRIPPNNWPDYFVIECATD